jgi:hypothetical protein
MSKQQDRLDGNESLFFARELEAIDNRIYDVKFPLLKGRMLLPKVADVGETDDTYTYRTYETRGKAKIIAPGAKDLPSVEAQGEEFTSRIKPLGDKYGYDIFEIKAAAAKGKPLSDLLARAARQAIEESIDDLLAFGSTEHQMKGFINNSEVDDSTFVPGDKGGVDTWLNAGAPNATGAQMVADVNTFLAQRWNAMKEAQGLNGKMTLVLPAMEYAYLASTPMGDNADKTALQYLLSNSPFLDSVESWHKLSGAGAGNANRMICFVKDPMVCGALIPMEFSPQPYQQYGLNFEIPCIARCGGVVIRYPVAVAYGDGI